MLCSLSRSRTVKSWDMTPTLLRAPINCRSPATLIQTARAPASPATPPRTPAIRWPSQASAQLQTTARATVPAARAKCVGVGIHPSGCTWPCCLPAVVQTLPWLGQRISGLSRVLGALQITCDPNTNCKGPCVTCDAATDTCVPAKFDGTCTTGDGLMGHCVTGTCKVS